MEEFNSYIRHKELTVLKDLCLRHGRLTRLRKKDFFCRQGEITLYVAYIEKGLLRYTCLNEREGKEYSVGFAFTHEFVADYPGCLHGIPSEVTIQAATDCTLYRLPVDALKRFIEENPKGQYIGRIMAEQLFLQIYPRLLDTYRKTIEERYNELLQRCPYIIEVLSLREIASFLRVTPETISHIRKKILVNVSKS